MTIKEHIPDIIGWIGSLIVLIAYISHKNDIITDTNILDIMNITGSTCVGYVCYLRKAWQPLFLNSAWLIVGCVSLIF